MDLRLNSRVYKFIWKDIQALIIITTNIRKYMFLKFLLRVFFGSQRFVIFILYSIVHLESYTNNPKKIIRIFVETKKNEILYLFLFFFFLIFYLIFPLNLKHVFHLKIYIYKKKKNYISKYYIKGPKIKMGEKKI